MKKLYKFNKEKFQDTNILFITGTSGSGKSTLAYDIADKIDADVISLDWYYDNLDFDEHEDLMCDKFNEFLFENLPEIKTIEQDFEYYEIERFKGNSDDGKFYWEVMDKLVELIKPFAEQNDVPVIVEGIQLYDSTIQNPEKYLENETLYVIVEDPYVCAMRLIERDELTNSFSEIYARSKKSSLQLNKFINNMISET